MSVLEVKVGQRYRSVCCETEVIVVRAPSEGVDLRCGGHTMVSGEDQPSASHEECRPDWCDGTRVGARFQDAGSGLEVLVTKAGEGSLGAGEVPLELSQPKRLPSSD